MKHTFAIMSMFMAGCSAATHTMKQAPARLRLRGAGALLPSRRSVIEPQGTEQYE
jgi:hypothetical protein